MATVLAELPPPPVVREQLAEHIREGRILRRLLRLCVAVAEHQQKRHQGGGRPMPTRGISTSDRSAAER
jgi:hypothetical protein